MSTVDSGTVLAVIAEHSDSLTEGRYRRLVAAIRALPAVEEVVMVEGIVDCGCGCKLVVCFNASKTMAGVIRRERTAKRAKP